MRASLSSWLAGASLVLLAAGSLAAQEQKPDIKRVPARTISSLDGKDNFQEYCAVCHGADAKGKGPAAPALKTPPADLTTIAKRRNGTFPFVEVSHIIDGTQERAAHGNREMPIWGSVFRGTGASPDDKTPMMRIQNLVDYLKSLQVK
jgi:mono/diheme cytochrome c family protein